MNLIEIMGNVGSDPEERVTPSGAKVITFRIADNVRRGDNQETIWWRVTVWGDQFDRMMPYIKKGSSLIVHGEIRRRPEVYQDREGNHQVSLEVTATMLRFSPFGRSDRSQNQEGSEMQGAYAASSAPSAAPGGFRPGQADSGDDFSDDKLPF